MSVVVATYIAVKVVIVIVIIVCVKMKTKKTCKHSWVERVSYAQETVHHVCKKCGEDKLIALIQFDGSWKKI